MRISDRRRRIEGNAQKILHTFERLRSTVGFSHRQWADLLRLTLRDYRKVFSGHASIPAYSLIDVADAFELNIAALAAGSVDFRAVAEHFNGNSLYIPEKYTVAAFSKKRSLLNILDSIETSFGMGRRNEIMREFQLTDGALANPDEAINIRLMTEVFETIGNMGFSHQFFSAMGASSMKNNRMTTLRRYVEGVQSPSSAYDQLVNGHAAFFDRNCEYKIQKLSKTGLILLADSSEEVKDGLGVQKLGNLNSCAFKGGVLSGFPSLLSLPNAIVRETSCIHRNDSTCRFELNFEHASGIANSTHLH